MTDLEILMATSDRLPISTMFPSGISDLASYDTSITNVLKSTATDLTTELGVTPEQLIYIYYSVLSANDQNDQAIRAKDAVLVNGLTLTSTLDTVPASINRVFTSILPGIIPSIYEVQAHLPSMPELESSTNYARNAILMKLELILNPATGNPSPLFRLPIKLPEPFIGSRRVIHNSTAEIGNPSGSSASAGDGTDHLGAKTDTATNPDGIGGQVRWYNMETWKKIDLQDLTTTSFSEINQVFATSNEKVITLPTPITDKTKPIRQTGTLLKMTRWNDDGVSITLPTEPGFAVIWRDDIPSKPIPFLANLIEILAITPREVPLTFDNLQNLNAEALTRAFRHLTQQATAELGVQPEQLIYVYYAAYQEQNQNAVVRATGVTELPELHRKTQPKCAFKSSYPDMIPSIYEAQVYTPAMTQLQTSPHYRRNAIIMWQEIQIINKAANTKSDPAGFPIWLPKPHMGKPRFTGTVVEIGTTVTGPNRVDDADHLGAPSKTTGNEETNDNDGGQIRWYAPSTFNQVKVNNSFFSLTGIDDAIDTQNNKVITLPPLVAESAKAIRQMGTLISPLKWHDDGVSFNIPDEPGFALIWRDDIPSTPIPLFDDLKEYIERKIADWAKELWTGLDQLSWAHFTIDVDTGLPDLGVDNMLDLAILRGVASANNLLAQWINDQVNGLSVQFAVILGKMDNDSAEIAQKDFEQIPSYVSLDGNTVNYHSIFSNAPNGETLKFKMPWVGLQSTDGTKNSCFTIKLQLIINTPQFDSKELGITIPALGPFTVPLGTYNFRRERLLVPTMAIFFQHSLARDDWGAPLILLPEDTGLYPSGQYDAYSTTNTILDQVKNKVTSILGPLKTLLSLAKIVSSSDILDLVDKIACAAGSAVRVVINTTGTIDDLRTAVYEKHIWPMSDSSFDDTITGVILLGIPASQDDVFIRCNTDPNHTGDILQFSLPTDSFIAVSPNVSDITRTYGNIPRPNISYTKGRTDYNDAISSVEFVILDTIEQS